MEGQNNIQISFLYDEKDGRWRWLAEVEIKARAGEAYTLPSAMKAAHAAVDALYIEVHGD